MEHQIWYYERHDFWSRGYLGLKSERGRLAETTALIPADVRTLVSLR